MRASSGMRIVIVSKTRMGGPTVCVGGINIDTRDAVRLMAHDGKRYPSINTPFEIGQLWDIDYQKVTNIRAPHIEDVAVQKRTLIGIQPDFSSYLTDTLGVPVWRGPPSSLFDGYIQFTSSGSGYISTNTKLPSSSTGFWLSDRDLHERQADTGKIFYEYSDLRKISYVGLIEALPIIPAGTLLRVSLARWWKPDDVDIEERCYLQLSGWYKSTQ